MTSKVRVRPLLRLSGQITDNYSARERLDSGLRLF
jgi:hypothetical protein